jgi:hypothetical protein
VWCRVALRFDGRALIDIIPAAPTAAVRAAIEETEEERELVDALNYERFYMLVENTHGSAPRTLLLACAHARAMWRVRVRL